MRQIKFRGKRLDNGEWAYGDLVQTCGEADIFYDDEERSYTPGVNPK